MPADLNILLLENNQHRVTFFQNGLRPHHLTICRHAKAAIKSLKQNYFDLIFLDHDLEDGAADVESKNCGSEVARFMAESRTGSDSIIVLHTENDEGRASMEALLPHALSIPYGKLKAMGFHALIKQARNKNPFPAILDENTP